MKISHYLSIIAGGLLLLSVSNARADEVTMLKVGEWKGSFVTHQDKYYKVLFNINYVEQDENKALSIEMINLDNNLTYQLTEIKIQGKLLEYKIPGSSDTKTCQLEMHDDNKFKGMCSSDKAENGETSRISMRMPSE